MSVIFIIHFDVKKEKQNVFSNMMCSVKTELPLVEGCVEVNIFQNIAQPQRYTLVEKWETKKLHEQHVSHLIKTGMWDQISALIEKEPHSDYFDIFKNSL